VAGPPIKTAAARPGTRYGGTWEPVSGDSD
jgi:hypothetical protein